MKEFWKRIIGFTAASALAVGLLTGCGDKNGGVAVDMDTSQPITIEMMVLNNTSGDGSEFVIKDVVKEKFNIDIKFSLNNNQSHFEKLKLLIASNELPDIVAPLPADRCKLIGPKGALAPLDEYFEYLPNVVKYLEADKVNMVSAMADDGHIYALPRFAPDARYVQLDVGQGDAAILRHGRHATLVDVGAANSYDALRYLRHEGLYVDSLLLSHLDEDHAGALNGLMQSEIDISRGVMPSGTQVEDASTAVQNGFRTAEEKGVLPEIVSAGDRIVSGDYVFDVLSPREGLTGENERSLVLYTQSMGTKILMMGDLPAKSEMDDPPDCDVLKVAHHGSKYATSDAFVEKTTPSLAMISVGANNRYGHPTERVIKALESVGAAIYRTDESGCITLWLSDKSATVQTYLHGSSSTASPAKRRPKPSLRRKPLLSPRRRSCWRRFSLSSSSETAVPPQHKRLTTRKRKNIPPPSAKKVLDTSGLICYSI